MLLAGINTLLLPTVLLVIILSQNAVTSRSSDMPMCSEGEYYCSSCYDLLASQAINSARNRFNLQRTFFPSLKENPVVVEVTYKFDVETTNGPILESYDTEEDWIWFWTSSPYHLFQPVEVLQFTSFFFADYANRKSNVTLHLPRNCSGDLEDDQFILHMRYFTQRLKLYAMTQELHPQINDHYLPKAESVETLKKVQEHGGVSYHTTKMTLAFQLIFPILASFFLTIYWIYVWEVTSTPSMRSKLEKGYLKDDTNSLRLSADHTLICTVVTSCTAYVYIIGLDIIAMYAATHVSSSVQMYYAAGRAVENFNYEFSIVFIIFAQDIIFGFVVWVTVIIVCYKLENSTFLVYAPLLPLCCVLTHAHHILIGFIHTPYHAGSVLISYGVIIIVFLMAFKSFHYAIIFCWGKKAHTDKFNMSAEYAEKTSSINLCFYWSISLLLIIIATVASVLTVLIVTIFVLVPIDNAIDDAANQLLTIERTVVILLAVPVAYKLFSSKSNSLLAIVIEILDKQAGNEQLLESKIDKKQGNEPEWLGLKIGKQAGNDGQFKKWLELEIEEKYHVLVEGIIKVLLNLISHLHSPGGNTDGTQEPGDTANSHQVRNSDQTNVCN